MLNIPFMVSAINMVFGRVVQDITALEHMDVSTQSVLFTCAGFAWVFLRLGSRIVTSLLWLIALRLGRLIISTPGFRTLGSQRLLESVDLFIQRLMDWSPDLVRPNFVILVAPVEFLFSNAGKFLIRPFVFLLLPI